MIVNDKNRTLGAKIDNYSIDMNILPKKYSQAIVAILSKMNYKEHPTALLIYLIISVPSKHSSLTTLY
jgi:hypothetical protein